MSVEKLIFESTNSHNGHFIDVQNYVFLFQVVFNLLLSSSKVINQMRVLFELEVSYIDTLLFAHFIEGLLKCMACKCCYNELGLIVLPGSIQHEYFCSSNASSLLDFMIPYLVFNTLLPL